ncbi:hypothetical protein KY385_03480 [Candidatus Parcubacteria bacterium]|nr:hypothetical protein [Candidatus Parcubacteria bacterium]
MFVLIHVLIAISTLVYTSYLYFYPAPNKFTPAYWMLGFTIASGTLLIFTTGANILKTCLIGLAYIGAVCAVIILAKHKLASQQCRLD